MSEPTRVLLIDDNPDDRSLARRAMERELGPARVWEVGDEPAFAEALKEDGFDVAVTDYQLRWSDGLAVLDRIRNAHPDVPVIMFTNTGTEEVAVEAMKRGLFDYILKTPQHYVRLPIAVKAALRSTQVQRQLAALESRYRVVGEAIPFGVWLAGAEGDLTYASQSFLDLLEMTLTDASGHGWINRLIPDDIEPTREHWRRCVREGCDWDSEFRIVGRGAKVHTVLSRGRPIRDAAGKVLGWAGINLDISDRKEIERQRDEALQNERSARFEAERANRLKDDFLATVSHELRTPLNAILGWAQMLSTGQVKYPDVEQGIRVIERNARAQVRLIEDLLDMSRIVTGKLRLDLQTVQPATAVESAVQAIRPAVEAKSLRLSVSLDPDAGPVRVDPGRLQQIVWNLLTNAVKFTPPGGRVGVSLVRVASRVVITISDTGEGIDAGVLTDLFDRFRQADNSSARRHGGLGLGLPIVKHLTELQGGSVRAHSEGKGNGATFIVTLPVIAAGAQPTEEVLLAPPASANISLAGLRVLVVEDEPDSLDIIRRILTSRDAEVAAAASTAEAFAAVTSAPPDVLVSDIGLPGEDGYSLIAKVRDLPEDAGGRVPAIALTAYARSEDRQRTLLAGFQMHLAKPVQPAELVAAVASLAWRRA